MTKMLNFKNNTKELWRLINKSIGKTKNTGSIIPFITVEGITINNPDKIADKFGQFYLTLGSNLALQIKKEQNGITGYLRKIPQNIHSMVLTPTTQHEVKKTIDGLPTKSRSRHDNVSNTLLKSLSESLTYPLTLIFNQLF